VLKSHREPAVERVAVRDEGIELRLAQALAIAPSESPEGSPGSPSRETRIEPCALA